MIVLTILVLGAILYGLQVIGLSVPWWGVVAAAGLAGFLAARSTGLGAFGKGFLAGTILWGGYAAFLSWRNDMILADRLAGIFSLPNGLLALLLTALLGGLVTGSGAWAGWSARQIFQPRA